MQKKHSFTLTLLFASSAIWADAPCCDAPLRICAPENCSYLPSARRCITAQNQLSQANFYGSLDFLYWEATERGLEFAIKNGSGQFAQNLEVVQPEFGFEPAFRIGVGYHLPYDNWDIEFSYALFQHETTNQSNQNLDGAPTGAGILPVWSSSIAFNGNNFAVRWGQAQAQWTIHSNFFDLLMKHRLCTSPALSIEPGFGLKLALLQQRYQVSYTSGQPVILGLDNFNPLSSTIAMNNRSLNLGPTAALTTRWSVYKSIDLVGSLSGALLASRFSIGRDESDIRTSGAIPTFEFIRENDHYWVFRPQSAISLGIAWSNCHCLKESVIHYGFGAFYEAQIWWKQNMLYRYLYEGNPGMVTPTQGNLFFHGLTVDAFIDF